MGAEGEPKPDESKFHNMEVEAAAGGAEAEARRQEMAKWSDAAGAYAEQASKQSNERADRLAARGRTAEQVKADSIMTNKEIAEKGLFIQPDLDDGFKDVDNGAAVKPTEKGMQIGSQEVRSPAQFRKSESEEDKEAA